MISYEKELDIDNKLHKSSQMKHHLDATLCRFISAESLYSLLGPEGPNKEM